MYSKYCRCRHGYFHVVNNDYTHWEMYAIGGSANPTINSQGNRFLAPNDRSKKEVYLRPDQQHLIINVNRELRICNNSCRWPSTRMRRRVSGDVGIGGQKGTWCWMEPSSGKPGPVHLQPMPELLVWVLDHLLLWVQLPWLLVHLTVGVAPTASFWLSSEPDIYFY